MRALIDGLVQTRVKKVPVWYWEEGWVPDRSLGRTYYREGYRFVDVPEPVPNDAVRKALVEYTGQDFAYDKSSWKRWYDERTKRAEALKAPPGDTP
jgi:hypothetical protein